MTQISQNIETDVLIKIKSKYKKKPSQIGMLSHCVPIRTRIESKGVFFCK